MIKAKKTLTTGFPRIPLVQSSAASKPSEPSLLVQRIRELDREFARQTKQLTALTRRLSKKLTQKL